MCESGGEDLQSLNELEISYKFLYDFNVIDLSLLFSSPARILALRALFCAQAPLPLRHVAYLTRAPLFSIQRALEQLAEEGLVLWTKKKNYRLFSLNHNHPSFPYLGRIFEIEREGQIARSNRYDQRAKDLLAFIDGAGHLLKVAKRGSLTSWT